MKGLKGGEVGWDLRNMVAAGGRVAIWEDDSGGSENVWWAVWVLGWVLRYVAALGEGDCLQGLSR